MTGSRSGLNSRRDPEWKKRKKEAAWGLEMVLNFLFSVLMIAGSASAWEEGDDAVNVISVENMDELLGLRMVTELKSFEGIRANGTGFEFLFGKANKETEKESRLKRMIKSRKTHAAYSKVQDFCSLPQCNCTIEKGESQMDCNFQNKEFSLQQGTVPSTITEIRLSNATKLQVFSGTFSKFSLKKAVFDKIDNLTFYRAAFQNLTTHPLRLRIENCKIVHLKDRTLVNQQKPANIYISKCENVILKSSAFYWFTRIQINNVPNLELAENTFSTEVKNFESTEMQIHFSNVNINTIPNATFPLNFATIVFFNCAVMTVKSGAFNGISLVGVFFKNTQVKRLESGAFSERTLIKNVEFDNADLEYVDSNGLSAAVTKFSIKNSRVEQMTSGAFNAHTASLEILNNDFRKIRRKAFEIRNWNSIFIHGNLFQSVEPDFFSAPFTKTAGVRTEFVFTNNTFPSIEVGALSFIPRETELYVTIENNTIESVCHCYLKAWIRERTGDSWESFYKTSFCLISDLLRYCYNISKDRMNMHDYAEHFCTSKNVQNCEDVQKIDSEDNLTPLNLNNMGQTFLSVIFLSVISSVALVIAIITLIWARRKGFCGYKRKSSGSDLPLCCSNFCNQSNLVSTDSISRVNIHEYAEIQNQLNTLQKQANPATEDNAEGEEFVECENRATQTLPEELTQELIQSLREKLEDPENYNEARTMIEHLYDLIKVEESCNKDNVSLTTSFGFGDEDEDIEGLYEVVDKPKPLSVKNVKRKTAEIDVTSRGTRVPSPDKLSPIDFNVARRLPVVVSDYVEPRDRKSNEYCELPAAVNPIMPDVLTSSQIKENSDSAKCHIYAEPLTSSKRKQLPNKDNQPQTSHS